MHIRNQPLSHTFTIFHLLVLLHSLILQHIYVILVCTKNTSLIHGKPYPIARICKDCVIRWKTVNIKSSIYIHLSISRVCRKCKKALQVQGNCPLAWCFWCCNFTSGRSRFAASVPVTSRYIYIYYNFLQPTTSQIAPTFNQSWTPSRIDLNPWSDQIKSTQMRRNYTREAKFNTLFKSQASQVDWLGRSLIAHDINEVPENGVCRSLWKHHQNLLMSER